MKNKLNKMLVPLLITVISLLSCHHTTMEKELILNDNLYYENNSLVPFFGRVLARYSFSVKKGALEESLYEEDVLLNL